MNSEYCLMGIVLNNPEYFPRLMKNIFLDSKCKELYFILEKEFNKSKGFTKETVLDAIKDNATINQEDYYTIYDCFFDYEKFDIYYNYVLNAWALSKADILIRDIRSRKVDNISDLKQEIQKIISELSVNEEKEIHDSQEVILKMLDSLNNNEPIELIKSNLDYVDQYHGFERGDFVIIAARPGIGKSSLVYNLIFRDMQKAIKSAIFSLEAKEEKIFRIIGCIASGVDTVNVRGNILIDQDKKKIYNAFTRVYENRIQIDDSVRDIESIKRKAKLLVDNEHIKKLYIDYLGLIETKEGKTRYEKVSYISRELKKIAMDLNIAIISLHQLNRDSEKGDKRPQLYHLRDSGSIEQDADVVVLLSREIADVNSSEEFLILDYAKTREFPLGEEKYIFHKATRRVQKWRE